MSRTRYWSFGTLIVLFAAAVIVAAAELPQIGAGGLLYPHRRPVSTPRPPGCDDAVYPGDGVALKGWRCAASTARVGTLVFLHGIADNRAGVAGVAPRFVPRGFDVIAYDSRAQGESGGSVCTYGYWEKRDLKNVIDTIPSGPVVLLGTSLGAAVALQEAADDPRVSGIVAAEVFSDLRTVARERAPFFFTEGAIRRAFAIAEERGRFRIDDVRPVDAARNIHVPVLLIHGAADTDTRPDHSRRVFDALGGPKELILIDGAHHNQSLQRGETWQRIEDWIRTIVPPLAAPST